MRLRLLLYLFIFVVVMQAVVLVFNVRSLNGEIDENFQFIQPECVSVLPHDDLLILTKYHPSNFEQQMSYLKKVMNVNDSHKFLALIRDIEPKGYSWNIALRNALATASKHFELLQELGILERVDIYISKV